MSIGRSSFFAFAIMLSAGVLHTTAQSSPTSQRPTSGPTAGCGYVNPGDGTGITVAMANAMNAAAAQRGCGTTPIQTMKFYAPRTPASSAYMNALQRYLTAMGSTFSSPVRPSGAGPDSTSDLKAASVIDPDSFAKAGKDSISKLGDDLLDHCPEAVQYVDSRDGLVKEFDKVMAQYQIRKDGLASAQKIKDELLDDTWWARSSGPDVAREVKFLANTITDVFGMISPEGDVVKGIEQIQNVSTLDESSYRTVEQFDEYAEKIKATYEQQGDVHDATVGAAVDATKKLLGMTKYSRAVPFIDFAQQLYDRAETEKAGFKFKVEVEYQVRQLDTQMNEYQNQINDYGDVIDAINTIHDTVIGVCVQKSVPIGNGPSE